MPTPRHGALRDLVAFLVILVACPAAVFGGANLGCVGSASFNGDCALNAVFISPLLLLAAGTIAGIATRGWTGLLIVLVATVAGMFSILFLSFAAGRPVPVGPIEGTIATIFFAGPIVIGYGIGRVIVRLFETRTS
jgi:hypothetical protein